MYQREDGIVEFDPDICIGCKACMQACPYDAIYIDLMSGVMIKTAVYALIRIYFDFLGGQFPWWWGFALLLVGTLSAILGVMYALMEHDLKRLLAFHSVENIGIILMAIGAGMIFQTYGLKELAALGLLAGLYHTINHAMFKSLLFMPRRK